MTTITSPVSLQVRSAWPGRPTRGFTLIELMIAVVIVGVLAALAYPSFLDSIRKGRRSEAFSAIASVQQSQERWRSNNPSYTTVLANTAASTAPPNGLGVPATTSSGYYGLDVSAADAFGYITTATAVSGTSQDNDGNCKVMGARMAAGGTLSYGSGASTINWAATDPDAGRCWSR